MFSIVLVSSMVGRHTSLLLPVSIVFLYELRGHGYGEYRHKSNTKARPARFTLLETARPKGHPYYIDSLGKDAAQQVRLATQLAGVQDPGQSGCTRRLKTINESFAGCHCVFCVQVFFAALQLTPRINGLMLTLISDSYQSPHQKGRPERLRSMLLNHH